LDTVPVPAIDLLQQSFIRMSKMTLSLTGDLPPKALKFVFLVLILNLLLWLSHLMTQRVFKL